MRLGASSIIHPILFSIYPVLFLFSRNISDVDVLDLLLPIVITSALGLFFWLVAWLLFRNWLKAALVSSISILMLLLFRHPHAFLVSHSGWHVAREHFLIFWLLLYTVAVFTVLRQRRALSPATRFCNLLSLMLVVMTCLSMTRFYFDYKTVPDLNLDTDTLEWVKNWRRSGTKGPDVYYIVLDGYGRSDALEISYGFDNADFLDGLQGKEFFVAKRSTTNYSKTRFSLASSLNMKYIHDEYHPTKWTNLAELIKYNKVCQLFRGVGYKYVFIPSGYSATNHSPMADRIVDLGVWNQSQLSALIIESSAVWFLSNWAGLDWMAQREHAITRAEIKGWSGIGQWHRHITRSFDALSDIAETEKPTFTFAHIVCPHPPYVFKRDGSLNTRSKVADLGDFHGFNSWYLSQEFIDQLVYLNKLLEHTISKILDRSEIPPIIILQADHGTRALTGKRKLMPKDPPDELVKERMSILFACHGPDTLKARLYHSITPVNIFRILFNECFGAKYSLLADRNFWSHYEPIQEVTYLLEN